MKIYEVRLTNSYTGHWGVIDTRTNSLVACQDGPDAERAMRRLASELED
jgi:hypothetical protein